MYQHIVHANEHRIARLQAEADVRRLAAEGSSERRDPARGGLLASTSAVVVLTVSVAIGGWWSPATAGSEFGSERAPVVHPAAAIRHR